jgi:hypothetical protein
MPGGRARTAAVATPAATGRPSVMLRCRVFGHRYRFSARGAVMLWEGQRGCGAGGKQDIPLAGGGTPLRLGF